MVMSSFESMYFALLVFVFVVAWAHKAMPKK